MRIIGFEYRAPREVVLNNNELRKYGSSNSALLNSIATFGFIDPVIVDQEYVVICGENRVMAARRLELESIPVLLVEASEKEKITYPLINNQVSDMTGWNLVQKKRIVEEQNISKGMYGMTYELGTTDNVDSFFTEDDTISLFDL